MLDRLVAQASQDSSVPGPLLGGPLPQRRPDRPMPRPAADASRRTGRDAALAAGRVLRRGGGRPFPHPARSAGLGVLRADHRPTPAAIHARTRPRHATTPTARGRRPHPAGHRRGELAALRLDDLRGRVLHISRADSAGHLTTPKSGHGRTLTLGAGTARLWHTLVAEWEGRAKQPIGPWVFSADPDHRRRLDVATLGHRFTRLRETAGIPDATLHRAPAQRGHLPGRPRRDPPSPGPPRAAARPHGDHPATGVTAVGNSVENRRCISGKSASQSRKIGEPWLGYRRDHHRPPRQAAGPRSTR